MNWRGAAGPSTARIPNSLWPRARGWRHRADRGDDSDVCGQTRLELALREAELRALEAQINPHFLFNCLNSIRGLVTEDPKLAQDMITRFAALLPYNLHGDVGHTVPLSVGKLSNAVLQRVLSPRLEQVSSAMANAAGSCASLISICWSPKAITRASISA